MSHLLCKVYGLNVYLFLICRHQMSHWLCRSALSSYGIFCHWSKGKNLNVKVGDTSYFVWPCSSVLIVFYLYLTDGQKLSILRKEVTKFISIPILCNSCTHKKMGYNFHFWQFLAFMHQWYNHSIPMPPQQHRCHTTLSRAHLCKEYICAQPSIYSSWVFL